MSLARLLLIAVVSTPVVRADDPPSRAILIDRCVACHSAEVHKGGLDLSTRESALKGGDGGPAIVPNSVEESLLIDRVAAGEMPPDRPLAAEQVEVLRRWIDSGAPYQDEPYRTRKAGSDWWSLQPIRRPELPRVSRPEWVREPLDAFVLAKLDEAGLQPSAEAEPRDWLRRVTFDLTGLAPSPAEMEEFLSDGSPDRYERVVDRLLGSTAYGERWARHWLDVARFAESHGYETNQLRPNAWPYRDWVIRAHNLDLPFAQFVREQLAGDTLDEADWLSRSATGFLVGGTHDVVANQAPEAARQQRVDDLDDMITAVGTGFLGLTVHCARCHDHKFDPIAQKDYYGLQALLAGVRHADRDVPAPDAAERLREAAAIRAELADLDLRIDSSEPIARLESPETPRPAVNSRRNVERFAPTAARSVRFTIRATNNGIEPCLDELEIWTAGAGPRNVAIGARPTASSTYPNAAIHRLEHINDGRLGNSRSWISAEMGKGWIELELTEPAIIDRIVWGRDREQVYADRTPTDYTIAVRADGGDWRDVASSIDRQPFGRAVPESPADSERAGWIGRQKTLRDRLATLKPAISVYAGTFEMPPPTHLLRRGDPSQPGKPVAPSSIASIQPRLELPADAPEPSRRRALADWLSDRSNPLPPRVVVNRVWLNHFGQGIVDTPGDFGFNGDRPSHPRLLDWLADEFLRLDGRLKPLHRSIVLSATYRQSSQSHPAALAVDRSGRLLWRFPPRRLSAEEIRDAILNTSGQLDRRMGGPGYWIWEPNTNYVVVFKPLIDLGPSHLRRMVYQYRPRSQPDPTFGSFDCPDGGLVAPRRSHSTTALQALNLLNSRFILRQAEAFADRLRTEAGDNVRSQVDRGFLLAYGRRPTDDERNAAESVVRDHGAAVLARALFNSNEFLFVP